MPDRLTRAAVASVVALTAAPSPAAETVTYTYDVLGRLMQEQYAGSINNALVVAQTLDANGNRTRLTISGSANLGSQFGGGVIVVPLNGFTVIPLGN